MRQIRPLSLMKFIRKEIIFKNHNWPQTLDNFKQRIYGFHWYMRWGLAWLTIFITSRCTLQCNFCYYRSPWRSRNLLEFKDMSFRKFVWIIDKYRQANGLGLTGGEPFLNKNIFDMIKYAHKHKLWVEMPTNGTLLHDYLDQIIRSFLSLLNISLDASDSNEYRKMRGGSKGVFETVVENIRDLVEKRNKSKSQLTLRVSFICTKENYQRIPEKVRLVKSLGADIVIFENLIPWRIPSFLEDQCLYDDDYDVEEVIKSIAKQKNLVVFGPTLYQRNLSERNCSMPFINLSIDPEGNISTCCMVAPHRDWGNVFYNKDVWNNISYQKIRIAIMDESLPLPSFCKTCHGLGCKRIVLKD